MDPSIIDCVIYHGDCSDGFGAAWAAWKLLGNKAEYIAAYHGAPPPNVAGKHVIVLDFAFDRKTTKAMMKDAASFTMRDHHKSAMIMLEGIAKPDWFQLEHSGCRLSWEFFHPGMEPPRFLKFIENRDMGWKPYMEYSAEFSLAFDMIKMDFESYDKMLNASSVDNVIKIGAHILPYAQSAIDLACKHAVRKELNCESWASELGQTKFDVLIVNSAHWISEIGTKLAPNCDFAIVWYWNHHEKYAKVSLRSFHPHVDCGSIAKRFGGGGHGEIAGFEFRGNIEDIFSSSNFRQDIIESSKNV